MPILFCCRSFWSRFVHLWWSVVGLVSCTAVGPSYQPPLEVRPVAEWQAVLPHGGSLEHLTDWWGHFADPALTTLITTTLTAHPSLEGAQAAIAIARAALTTNQAGEQVQAGVSGEVNRSGSGNTPLIPPPAAVTGQSVVVDASWELDLFGRVQRATAGAHAKVAARQADWAGLRVSLAAEVATLYSELRGCERLQASLVDEHHSRQQTATLTQQAIQAGLVAPSEEGLARAGLAEVRTQLVAQQAGCDLAIKGLVALSGLPEGEVRSHLAAATGKMPNVAPFAVTTMPVQLLSQRPDLASAEQELMAANAEIGVAIAARYPRFSLLGSVGVALYTAGSTHQEVQPWSFGPALTLPLLDGGVRVAAVQATEARYRQVLANYRQAVLNAVREVESALVNLASSQQRRRDTLLAAEEYAAFFQASEANFRTGGISLLTLEEARRRSIGAERVVIQLERQEVQQWITLYKALGGGFQQTTDPQPVLVEQS